MDAANVKHQLPLARIKKIMRADEDVRMVSAEAPVVFAKACELFILDITMRAWANASQLLSMCFALLVVCADVRLRLRCCSCSCLRL